MDLKVSDLKIGAKLVFGNYGVSAISHPISWLKANKECEFISEFVLDLLPFDAKEHINPDRNCRYNGNGNYEVSNIIQFMNSYEDDWYNPMHRYDSPPSDVYVNHPGFLHDFEDYEIESLASRIDLPTIANIYGASGFPKFPLFNRKGYRGRPTENLVYGRYDHDMSEVSFCSFWLSDFSGDYTANYVDRAGVKHSACAYYIRGLRPKCMIKPDTKVEEILDGSGFRIIPFDTEKHRRSNVCTDEEFMALMGLL